MEILEFMRNCRLEHDTRYILIGRVVSIIWTKKSVIKLNQGMLCRYYEASGKCYKRFFQTWNAKEDISVEDIRRVQPAQNVELYEEKVSILLRKYISDEKIKEHVEN